MNSYNVVIQTQHNKYYDKNWNYTSKTADSIKILENGASRSIFIKNLNNIDVHCLIKNIELVWDLLGDRIVVCDDYCFGKREEVVSWLNGNKANIIENNLMVLTVATKEVSIDKISQWIYTVNKFGYKYNILGRDQTWNGFSTKITLYLDELKKIADKYVCVVDCTDLFFCGYWWETLIKISDVNSCIVGGEKFMMYNKGKYPPQQIEKFISNKYKLYPNSGYILGKTDHIIDVFDYGKYYSDDQALCYDIILDKKSIIIDDSNTFVSNIPDYGLIENLNIYKVFTYDPSYNRYKNSLTNKYPIALHYPNKNWIHMDSMFKSIFVTETPIRNTSDDSWRIPATIVLFLFFFLLFYYMLKLVPH